MRTVKFPRMLLSIRFLVLSIIVGSAIASCQANKQEVSRSNQTDCRTIQHEMGETKICDRPQRIVVLGPYVLEPLLMLGLQPVGFGDHIAFHQGNYDNPSQQIPYLGSYITQPVANVGLAYEPSIEAIIKIQPDLIIGTEGNTSQYEILSNIAPTLLLKYDRPEVNLKAIALAVNRSQQVEPLLTETERQIAAARKAFAPLVATHPNLLLLSSSQLKEIYALDSTQLCTSLPKKLGFQLVSPLELQNSESNVQSIPISLETLPQFNEADLVIMLGHNFTKFDPLNNFNQHQLSKIKQAWSENAIAQAVGKSEQAERVIQEHSERITQTKQALQPIVDKYPRVLLLGSEKLDQGVEIDPYNHDSYCSALLADLGFQIVFPPNGEGKEAQGGKVSLEMLPQLAADLIIVQGYNRDFSKTKQDLVESQTAAVKQQWHNNAIAQSLPASQSEDASASPSERIYFTSAYLCRAMPGPIGAEIFLNQLQEQLLKSK